MWGSFARTGLPDATTQNATYNANNHLTSWNGTSLTYDPNGNLTGYGTQTFAWNDRNQLASTTGGAASFAYDGVGRRVSKTVGGATTKYLYDGANVVQEQDSGNVATANLLTGLGVDRVFSRTDSAGARSFLTDALGSTIALADPSGSITTSYTYEPFGAAASTGASSANSFQFTGRENDGASGLYFYRARNYSPAFGRFISEDPLGFPGGPDINVYAYVSNNPIGLVDPFGLDPGNGCGFLGSECWNQEMRDTLDALALGLAIGALLALGFAGGGWIIFGVVIDASVAGAVATAAGVVASAISLMTAQTAGQRVLAGAALVTSLLFPPAGIAAGVFAALWVSIVLTRYVVDEANS